MMKPMDMAQLKNLDIFELRPLITNLSCKLSAISHYDGRKQLLCLVNTDNDIVVRYTSEGGQEVLKLISWFRRTNRMLHDICFDPTGTWLLALCFDNTLHVVPALALVDKTYANSSIASQPPEPFSTTEVTSYIIPFVGPHECPNSKKCPNRSIDPIIVNPLSTNSPPQAQVDNVPPIPGAVGATGTAGATAASDGAQQMNFAGLFPKTSYVEKMVTLPPEKGEEMDIEKEKGDKQDNGDDCMVVMGPFEELSMEECSHDVPTNMLAGNGADFVPVQQEDQSGNSHVSDASFLASNTCPYPKSVVWWKTQDNLNRAVIGYSDGSICFVALSPNCPFVASTAIETGSVVKMLLCKDVSFDSVMLLVTSSLKQQYKLLLEQNIIKYIYPGDISPTTAQARDQDWQIVMPVKSTNSLSGNNGNTDGIRSPTPPLDNDTQIEEDVFIRSDSDVPSKTELPVNRVSPTNIVDQADNVPTACSIRQNHNHNNLPPPPPYSVAITRHVESASTVIFASGTSAALQQQQQQQSDMDELSGRPGLLPAARARLASLKSLGSKKLNAIRMRLSDTRQKMDDYLPENTLGSFAIMDSPSLTPELLRNTVGSFYTIQNLRSTYLLSALHTTSNSLSVHSMDINLKPLFVYNIPNHCYDILISSNILYSIQYVDLNESSLQQLDLVLNTEKEDRDTDLEKKEKIRDGSIHVDLEDKLLHDGNTNDTETSATISDATVDSSANPCNSVNAVGIISSAMASLRISQNGFDPAAQLAIFRFENETIIDLYQMATYNSNLSTETINKDEKAKAFEHRSIRSPIDYVNFYETADVRDDFSLRQMEIMQTEFPKINYDPCYVITNKNVYFIQLKKEPFALFLDAALAGEWLQCRQFCNTFDLNFEKCIEFAGDYLLRKKKVTQALLTYNSARIKPIRTALKLAMYGQTVALMHLCAMALKSMFLLNSKHFCHPIINSIMKDVTYRHSEDVRLILPPVKSSFSENGKIVNTGDSCSSYSYVLDDSTGNLQMSPSSQFHLANLLLITLAEKAVNDKNYIPLWNFLVTNTKYHTNMTSIVLCQSGLFSSAILLAKARGVCIDTFLALTIVAAQEFGWYTEVNVCLYNISENIFMETITYLPQVASDYFAFIQEKLPSLHQVVIKRLEDQLNPFSPIMRPVVSHTSSGLGLNDNNTYLFQFCKNLIEAYLAIIIFRESQYSKRDNIINALSTFRITYEDNQFAIDNSKFKPISAGCAHCACVVDGIAYFWGANGVPCNFSITKSGDSSEPPHAVKNLELLSQLNLEVHAIKCGRQHTLILTNNGLYTFGSNILYQLGIGKHLQMSLQPMLVTKLDGMNITILESGQYHNAAVANDQLYTWGWGVYGQLGHGHSENVAVPQLVNFFKYKNVIQVSLGHAHSLVLCQTPYQTTELFVFGSNHFGQLGIRVPHNESSNEGKDNAIDAFYCSNQVKSLVPLRLEVSTANIRLIHTKFFTNLAVDVNENMYTWGSSPQALRLANQMRRRANAKQKIEEGHKMEMNRHFVVMDDTMKNKHKELKKLNEICNIKGEASKKEKDSEKSSPIAMTDDTNNSDVMETSDTKEIPADNMDADLSSIKENLVSVENTLLIEMDNKLEDTEKTQSPLHEKSVPATSKPEVCQDRVTVTQSDAQKQLIDLQDPCEHMTPHIVDTSEVAGQILQISSGLFHFALISSTCTLYTWGKNLEHQLGTEDKERRAVNKPSPIDSIEQPMYVDCGADFTLVMTTDYVVKAFGGNSNGQCGRDLGPSIDKLKQRVVCLPTSKRLMRFESQCVEAPVDINLPRPRIRLDTEPVRYLKTIPPYKAHFLQKADINFNDMNFDNSSPIQQYNSASTAVESSEEADTGQGSEDLVSSIENLSNNDVSSIHLSPYISAVPAKVQNFSDDQNTPEEHSYTRLPNHTDNGELSIAPPHNGSEEIKNLIDGSDVQMMAATERSSALSSESEDSARQQLRHYIHYCLYVFHGLYHPDKIREFSKDRLEYPIRTLMLNFKFVEAFSLCLQDCGTSTKALKIFEYFSKDTGSVPMRRQEVKYLIYKLLKHFLTEKFDMLECERYFLADLNYYLLELAYVLYFNNNNTVLEQSLNEKFKILIAQTDVNQDDLIYKLEDTDVIFDSLSVKFKTIVCQRLIKYCSN